METVSFFIDGFNVYHALADNRLYHKYKWLDYSKLAKSFLSRKQTIENIYYFTALAHWNQRKVAKHRTYIKALQHHDVTVIHGKFKLKDIKCPKCKRGYRKHEEKMTDVNIAIKLFQDAIQDKYDKAIIISGDSDLLPSIEAVKSIFPEKKIGLIIPIDRRAEDLKNTVDFHMKMKEKHLSSSQLSNEITLRDGSKIQKPESWQ